MEDWEQKFREDLLQKLTERLYEVRKGHIITLMDKRAYLEHLMRQERIRRLLKPDNILYGNLFTSTYSYNDMRNFMLSGHVHWTYNLTK